MFPTTSLALGYWDLRATSSWRVVGWIHITRSPLKHSCFCCLFFWLCKNEFRWSSNPTSSQESLMCAHAYTRPGSLSVKLLTGTCDIHTVDQLAILHSSTITDKSLCHADRSFSFLILPVASCCHFILPTPLPARSIIPELWQILVASPISEVIRPDSGSLFHSYILWPKKTD